MNEGIGHLYLSVKSPSFVTANTSLGDFDFTPKYDAQPGPLSFSRYPVTEPLCLPVTIYETFDSSGKSIGYSFKSSVKPVKCKNGLLFRHSNKVEPPILFYKDDFIFVYHARNCYTLISRPFIPPQVEDLVFAI